MKTFICIALFFTVATASGVIGPLGVPIGVPGISPLGLGLAQQQLLLNGLGPQVISSPLGLGLGPTKIVGGGLPLNLGLGGLKLGSPLGLQLGSPLISSLNGGLLLGK